MLKVENVSKDYELDDGTKVIMSFTTDGLTGKVTLPATWHNMIPTSFMQGIRNDNLKYVFFEPGSQVKELESSGFEGKGEDTQLRYVELPNVNFRIGGACFRSCFQLFDDPKVGQQEVIDFFSKIGYVGANAFAPICNYNWALNGKGGGLSDKTLYITNQTNLSNAVRSFASNFLSKIQLGYPGEGNGFSLDLLPKRVRNGVFFSTYHFSGGQQDNNPIPVIIYVDDVITQGTDELTAWLLGLFGYDLTNAEYADSPYNITFIDTVEPDTAPAQHGVNP